MEGTKLRNYCFTAYDLRPIVANEYIKYLVYQLELNPETGNNHYQGYVELTKPCRYRGVFKILDRECRLAVREGNRVQARHYCMKPVKDCPCAHCEKAAEVPRIGNPIEIGVFEDGGQGKGTRFAKVKHDICLGRSLEQLYDDHDVMFTHNKSIEKYKMIKDMRARREKGYKPPVVNIVWGESGTGKTKGAVAEEKDYYILTKGNGSNVWWDGYNGEKHLIIDEFSGWLNWDLLLRILDGYPVQVEPKGGSMLLDVNKVTITSNIAPAKWYPRVDMRDLKNPLRRRVTKCTWVSRPAGGTGDDFLGNNESQKVKTPRIISRNQEIMIKGLLDEMIINPCILRDEDYDNNPKGLTIRG